MKIIKGDLISLAREGHFDIIAHGCNCQNVMGAGIAYQLSKEWPDLLDIDKEYRQGFKEPYNMMGTYSEYITPIEYKAEGDVAKWLKILNLYTQMWPGVPSPHCSIPFDHVSFTAVLRKVNYHFSGKSIGLPWIGCGLAGADKGLVRHIITGELAEMDVTIVEYEKATVAVDRGGLAEELQQGLLSRPGKGKTSAFGTAEGIGVWGGVPKQDGGTGDFFDAWADGNIDERPLDSK